MGTAQGVKGQVIYRYSSNSVKGKGANAKWAQVPAMQHASVEYMLVNIHDRTCTKIPFLSAPFSVVRHSWLHNALLTAR